MDSPTDDTDREARRAAAMAELRARTGSSDYAGTTRPAAERQRRFTGPIGVNDDGSPQRKLTDAEKQHKADILAGRKRPGDPITPVDESS